jgi:hypothetical protein
MSNQYTQTPAAFEAEQFIIWKSNETPTQVTILGNIYPVFNETITPSVVVPVQGGNLKCNQMDWIRKDEFGKLSVFTDQQFNRFHIKKTT